MTAIDFEHDLHRTVYEQLRDNLGELYPDAYRDDEGHFYVRQGSTVLEIFVEPYGSDEVAVIVSAYCVQGVRLEENLLLGLLEINHHLPFGGFSLVDDNVFFSYALFGHALDRQGLLGAIATVATVADDYDDLIVSRYGGQTALDKIGETGGRRRRAAGEGPAKKSR